MDNFNLKKYLKNNPLLTESNNTITRSKIRSIVREMILNENIYTSFDGRKWYDKDNKEFNDTFDFDYDEEEINSYDDLISKYGKQQKWFAPERSNAKEFNKADNRLTSKKMFDFYKDKYGPLKVRSKKNELVNEMNLNEMARIAKPSKLADDWEEKLANLPERFRKSSRFDRVIKYFQQNNDKVGQLIDPNMDPESAKAIDFYGTLAHIADEEFQSSDTASAAPIVAALKDAGVLVSGDFVTEPAKYSKEPSVPGAKGRPKTEQGYFQNAMAKFKEGNYDFSPEEKTALENMVKALQGALGKKAEPKAKKK
jgi:hypothetical protein